MQDPNAPFGQPPTTPPSSTPLALPPSGFTPSPAPYQKDEDYFGWIGLGLGIVSWLMCCCSIIPFIGLVANIFAFLMAGAAIVLGALSFRNARRDGGPTHLGIAAMVLGAARFGLVLLAIVIVVIMLVLGVGGGMLSALSQGMHDSPAPAALHAGVERVRSFEALVRLSGTPEVPRVANVLVPARNARLVLVDWRLRRLAQSRR